MRFSSFVPVAFFDWCEQTLVGHWLRTSTWGFATIETVHIIGLALVLGTTLVIDLRLLGYGLRRQPVTQIARELAPWTYTALVFTMVSGSCLFLAEAFRLGKSQPFFLKMIFFASAILIHFTIHWKATSPGARDGAWWGKLAACLSLICWLGVALSGRAIAFPFLVGAH
jgi:hypothetical protein